MVRKVIFLDFDGVVRLIPSLEDDPRLIIPAPEFDQEKLRMLSEWCVEAEAKIVVSSDLRVINTLEETSNYEEVLGWLQPGIGVDIIHEDWATPIRGPRWKEIMIWLSHHPEVTDYVIIDDFLKHFEDAPEDLKRRLVLTSNRFGVLPKHKNVILKILGHANYQNEPVLWADQDVRDSDL